MCIRYNYILINWRIKETVVRSSPSASPKPLSLIKNKWVVHFYLFISHCNFSNLQILLKETMEIFFNETLFQFEKQLCIPQSKLGLKIIVVNEACPFLNGGLLENDRSFTHLIVSLRFYFPSISLFRKYQRFIHFTI